MVLTSANLSWTDLNGDDVAYADRIRRAATNLHASLKELVLEEAKKDGDA